MRSNGLGLICENSYRIALVKGNYGSPLTASQYVQGINSYLGRTSTTGYSRIVFLLGKPNLPDKGNLNLIYQITPEANIPPRHFLYSVPQNTLTKFREIGEEVKSRRNEAYFQPLQNIFYYRNQAIPKVFPEKDLRKVMESLIKANEYFKAKYGNKYTFLGDIYTVEDETKFSKIAASLQRNKEDIKNLPRNFKDWWNSL